MPADAVRAAVRTFTATRLVVVMPFVAFGVLSTRSCVVVLASLVVAFRFVTRARSTAGIR